MRFCVWFKTRKRKKNTEEPTKEIYLQVCHILLCHIFWTEIIQVIDDKDNTNGTIKPARTELKQSQSHNWNEIKYSECECVYAEWCTKKDIFIRCTTESNCGMNREQQHELWVTKIPPPKMATMNLIVPRSEIFSINHSDVVELHTIQPSIQPGSWWKRECVMPTVWGIPMKMAKIVCNNSANLRLAMIFHIFLPAILLFQRRCDWITPALSLLLLNSFVNVD